ncbi:MAG: hypothetical protein HY840_13290 [Bacteroidetes bacterium]|nr:hypothetical protein [Bacteroidota bacterium]
MRTLFSFLSVLLLSGCLQPQKSDEEKERDRLIRNKIKSITEYKTLFTSNMAAKKEQPSHLKIFNAKGFTVKEINYNESGTAEHILTHEYDRNDNLICSITKASDSSLLGKATRSYDEKNNLKELIYFLPDGTIEYKYTYLYNSEGKMTEMNVYWPDVLSAVHTYIYDGKKKSEDAEYSAERKLLGKWNYKYDAHGNLLEAIRSDSDSGKNKKITYLYNTINQVIRQTTYSGEALQNTQSFAYNKKYFLSVKNEFSSDGKITARYRYQYNFL